MRLPQLTYGGSANVTATAGQTARLPCNIQDLGDRAVSETLQNLRKRAYSSFCSLFGKIVGCPSPTHVLRNASVKQCNFRAYCGAGDIARTSTLYVMSGLLWSFCTSARDLWELIADTSVIYQSQNLSATLGQFDLDSLTSLTPRLPWSLLTVMAVSALMKRRVYSGNNKDDIQFSHTCSMHLKSTWIIPQFLSRHAGNNSDWSLKSVVGTNFETRCCPACPARRQDSRTQCYPARC